MPKRASDAVRSEVSRLQLHQLQEVRSWIRENSVQTTSSGLKSHDFNYTGIRQYHLLRASIERGLAFLRFDLLYGVDR
jgi:hypothetical protein